MDKKYKLALSAAIATESTNECVRSALDTKAANVLGFAGTIMGLLFGFSLFFFESAETVKQGANLSITMILLIGLAILACAIVASLLALRIRNYRTGMGRHIFLRSLERLDDQSFAVRLITSYLTAAYHNQQLNDSKARWLEISFLSLGIGAILVFVSVAIRIFVFISG